jgi:type IV pilus assembly protein PilC
MRFGARRLKPKDFFSFNHEFLTLLQAGIPVVPAFDGIIANLKDPFFSRILDHIRNDVSDGESVSNAFEKHAHYFSPLYIAALRSGEASGNIPHALEEFMAYFERAQAIRQKIRAASVYPLILTVCAIAVIAFLLVFVVPAITGTFAQSGSDLPFSTTLLLQFSEFVKTRFWIIFSGTGGLVLGISYFLKTEKGRLLADTWWLKIPFAGELTTAYATALFTASLSTILAGGTPLNQALVIASGLIQNRYLQAKTLQAIEAVEGGRGFAPAMTDTGVFPDMALRMIAAGEASGSLETVLKNIARFYEKYVEARLTLVTSAIEPALMVLMGFIIGFIMLAMYMPIFQMAGTIG